MILEGTSVDGKSSVGDYTYIGKNCLVTRAKIGRYTSIGNNVSIGPGEHNIHRISTSTEIYKNEIDVYDDLTKGDVTIGHDVWIGTGATVRRGVIVGDGAVIGAHSFVNKDVPPYAVVAGIPAKLIKYRFNEREIQEIQSSEWYLKDIEEAREIIKSLTAQMEDYENY